MTGHLYQKYRNYIENGLFIIVLVFYPLIKINQGLDVVDTSYSLANFQYFPTAYGTWMVATFLANAVGYLFMQLPKGDTLVGMYFYTGLIVALIALLFYFALRKKIPAWIVFIGEMLAIGMCWCPTTILYNYLTYLLMGAGILLLYRGICIEDGVCPADNGIASGCVCIKERKRKYLYFMAAGICLGANVTVRMPNVVQAVFILALWYGAWQKHETILQTVKDTAVCLAGYLIGFGIPFAAICVKYGVDAYPAMVQTMFAMTDKAVDYKPTSMLTGMFEDYGKGLYWLIFAAICVGLFYVLYVIKAFCAAKGVSSVKRIMLLKKGDWIYRIICIAVCCVLIRFYWGQGMFAFRYYDYGSIYQWAVMFLLMTVICALSLLMNRKRKMEDKVLALLVLLQMLVTPLGSNNALYPIINNLFLTAPFTLWVCCGWFAATKEKEIHVPWKIMLSVLGVMVLVQSIGFHTQFVFLDGVWGEKRDTLLTGIPKTEGIYTNRENAELFSDLVQYAEDQNFAGREVILYGEIPGLSYFLDMPAAITTTWPDLDSYRLVQFEQDMELVEANMEQARPVVIVSSDVAAYKGEDAEAYAWFGVEEDAFDQDEKLQMLLQFLDTYGYEETFCNMRYAVYE